jgi:hypothetical protein
VSFVAITLCVASQRVFIVIVVYFVMTQSGNFWIRPRIQHRMSRQHDHVYCVNNNIGSGCRGLFKCSVSQN